MKIIKISVISVLLLISIGATAQPTEQRTDPEWLRTYVSGDFCWAYDVQVDQAGYVYTTGYFQRNLKLAQGKYIEPKSACYSRCPDTWFLMKHDPNGNLLWVRYTEGNSRPARIVIDPNGFIWVAGNFYGGKVDFITGEDKKLTLNGTEGLNSSLFVAHYNPQGDLLHLIMPKLEYELELFDFKGDKSGNFYLAGSKLYRSYDKSYEVKRTYALLKYDETFNFQWGAIGDTVGQSHISSVCADQKGNVIATGGFNNTFRIADRTLVTPDYNAIGFAFKLNQKVELEWITDSLGSYRIGAGASIAANGQGDVFLVTVSGYSLTCISKIRSNGKLEWSNLIKGKATMYNERLILDKQENIWLAGQGYGGEIGSQNGPGSTVYSSGGTDPYIYQFNPKGEILQTWAAGGDGTDYLKGIAISEGKLFGFGWFGGDMKFNDTIHKSRDGYVFWLARFDTDFSKKNLTKQIENNPVKNPADTTWNYENCTCEYQREKRTVFYPSLDAVVSYEDFQKVSGWTQDPILQNYKTLFYRDFQFSTSNTGGFYSMVLVALRHPLLFIHPQGTFGVNFTPCTNNLKMLEVPVTLNYEFQYKNYFDDLEKPFDYTAAAYFDFWKYVNQIGDEDLPEIPGYASWQQSIAENNLQKLEAAMADDGSELDLERLEYASKPIANAVFETEQIALVVSPNILRQRDPKTGSLLLNNEGQPAPARILAFVNDLTYSTEYSLQAEIREICMPWAEIGTSGMKIQFASASLVTHPGQLNYDLNALDGPGFPERDYAYQNPEGEITFVDPKGVLGTFTGLHVEDCVVEWPFAGKTIEAMGSGFLINNRMLAGMIHIPLAVDQPENTETHAILMAGEEEVFVSLQDLQNWLMMNGFDVVRFHRLDEHLGIYVEMKAIL